MYKSSILIILFAILMPFCRASAQDFVPREYAGVLYQEMENRPDSTSPSALVVFLHGRSGCGSDNKKQLNQAGSKAIAEHVISCGINATLLVPQCPEGLEWLPRDGRDGYLGRVENLVREYASRKDIDTSRIYLAGVSMGAAAVWRFIVDCPGLVAAALIASGLDPAAEATDYLIVPLYITAGSEEHGYAGLNRIASEIDAGGGKAWFDVLPGLGHAEACRTAFATKRLRWLFDQ